MTIRVWNANYNSKNNKKGKFQTFVALKKTKSWSFSIQNFVFIEKNCKKNTSIYKKWLWRKWERNIRNKNIEKYYCNWGWFIALPVLLEWDSSSITILLTVSFCSFWFMKLAQKKSLPFMNLEIISLMWHLGISSILPIAWYFDEISWCKKLTNLWWIFLWFLYLSLLALNNFSAKWKISFASSLGFVRAPFLHSFKKIRVLNYSNKPWCFPRT